MKKYIMLFSILFLMLACSEGVSTLSFNFEQADEDVNLSSYYTYIGKDINIITDKYGKPDIHDYLYGGELYYYDELPVAFGVDNIKITALFVFDGTVNKDIFIGASMDEILKNLSLTSDDIQYTESSIPFIQIEKDHLAFYLNFYNDILQEIIIKEPDFIY